MAEIVKSVGKDAPNRKADVIVVQKLLNNFTTGLGLKALEVDGGFGTDTGTAIRRFQAKVVGIANPDGRVDPGGRTLVALNGTAPPSASDDPSQLSGAAWDRITPTRAHPSSGRGSGFARPQAGRPPRGAAQYAKRQAWGPS